MKKEEFLELNPWDQLKSSIETSIESHKQFNTEFWNGSSYMAKNILETMSLIEKENPKFNHKP